MKDTYDGFRELAAAIVLQAYNDFKNDAAKIKKGRGPLNSARKEMADIVTFVNSDWFKSLTDIKPELFMERLQEVIKE